MKLFKERKILMKKVRRKSNQLYICLSVLLVIAIIAVCFIGQKKRGEQVTKLDDKLNKNLKVQAVKSPEEDKKIEGVKPEEKKEEKPKYDGPVKYNDKSIPILMYHSAQYLKEEPNNDLRVPKEKFREQMKFLKENGYTTLTMQEMYDFFKDNKPIPEKSVVITFDDGYADNYTNALPAIKEFGLKATVFVVTDWVGTNSAYMTIQQLKEMDQNGFDVQSHTAAHQELDKLTYEQQLKTLRESKEFLEKNLNKKIITICYPIGKFNENTIKAAQEIGYLMGLKMSGGLANKNNEMYTLNRVFVGAKDTIQQFEVKIKQK